MSTAADIGVERHGQSLVASLRGEVDMTNASYVREELTGAIPNDVLSLVLDLTEARYLDSAAIEVLFELSRRLLRRRQTLHLVVPADSPLLRVLTLTDVASVAPVHGSLAEALAAI